MPTQTFLNLAENKQQRIFQALVNEFAHHRLMEAQVARIIKECGIARGSFYKYFADLTDSYEYTLHTVLHEVHFDVFQAIRQEPTNSLMAFNIATSNFIHNMQESPYYDFYKLYVLYNQYELNHSDYDYRTIPQSKLVLKVDGHNVKDYETIVITYKWASQAAHSTIKQILQGANIKQSLADLSTLLYLLNQGLRKE
jgi:hypothetical protein